MNQLDSSKIQVPINNKTRKKAEKKAEFYGFSSIQEVIRLFLNDFAEGNIKMSFVKNTDEYISPEFESYLDKRLEETEDAIKNGTAYTIHSGEDLTQLAHKLFDKKRK